MAPSSPSTDSREPGRDHPGPAQSQGFSGGICPLTAGKGAAEGKPSKADFKDAVEDKSFGAPDWTVTPQLTRGRKCRFLLLLLPSLRGKIPPLGKPTTLTKPTERKNYYEVKAKDAARHLQELGNKRKLGLPWQFSG